MSRQSDLSPELREHVDAATAEVSPLLVDRAQIRLMNRLHAAGQPMGGKRSTRVLFALGAALALCALLAWPLLKQDGSSSAFAAVRAHFMNFKTLSMQIEQYVGGTRIQQTRVLVDAQGTTRTDVGEQLSIVVDLQKREVLTLLHDVKRARRTALPIGTAPTSGQTFDWLAEIRQFRGQAIRLPTQRLIDNQPAQGWQLDIGSQTMVLWVDKDGLPLSMEQHTGADDRGGMRLNYRFSFDGALDESQMSTMMPPGYAIDEGTEE